MTVHKIPSWNTVKNCKRKNITGCVENSAQGGMNSCFCSLKKHAVQYEIQQSDKKRGFWGGQTWRNWKVYWKPQFYVVHGRTFDRTLRKKYFSLRLWPAGVNINGSVTRGARKIPSFQVDLNLKFMVELGLFGAVILFIIIFINLLWLSFSLSWLYYYYYYYYYQHYSYY